MTFIVKISVPAEGFSATRDYDIHADAVAGAKAEDERPHTEEERAAIDANTASILAKRRK